ncbi:hypothetical protein JS44_16535 [Anoxybacillus flavithermus]|uniref:Transposase n=1 Tax=Anoxybacillus flavithermus TaxID=33934 RepID=A0A094IYE7_9BACL|nr:hypothetical protein JS44_16535 [Anoxybacillus flavithermus]
MILRKMLAVTSSFSHFHNRAIIKRSDEEERRLRSEVNEMETKEKDKVMELIISYEQKALEKGREEGMKQGIKQGMKRLVQTMAKKG